MTPTPELDPQSKPLAIDTLTDEQKRHLWEGTWSAYYDQYQRFREANPGWQAFFTAHHGGALDAALQYALETFAPLIAARAAEQERADEQAVIEAAKVWRVVRRDRQISGMTHHRACKALDEAVGHLIGELDREPMPPLTEAEMEEGWEVVRHAIAYNEAARRRGTTGEGDGR
jgi:hypothetical protein